MGGTAIGAARAVGEIIVVLSISFACMAWVSAAWTPYASPVGMLGGVAAALFFIQLSKEQFGYFGFRSAGVVASLSVIAALWVLSIGLFVYIEPLLEARFGPIELAFFETLEGRRDLYLLMLATSLIGAAFGEEVVYRGFVMTRVAQLFSGAPAGWIVAVIVQATVFALFHSYQGPVGVIEIFVYAMAAGSAYLIVRRSLWPLIGAHALIITFALTDFYLEELMTGWLRAML